MKEAEDLLARLTCLGKATDARILQVKTNGVSYLVIPKIFIENCGLNWKGGDIIHEIMLDRNTLILQKISSDDSQDT